MFDKPTPVVTTIIIACVVLYIPELLGYNLNAWMAVSPYSLQAAPWQLLTAAFAHGSIDHLAMNMVSLWWMGTMLERMQGSLRFCAVYFGGAIAGNLVFALLGNGFAVGASGGVFALLGAVSLMLYSMRGNPYAQSMLKGMLAMLGLNIVNSFLPGIALEAHLGGLAAGAAIEGIILLAGWKPESVPA